MVAVEELDAMEPAFVDIEMDVPCFEVGRTGLPEISGHAPFGLVKSGQKETLRAVQKSVRKEAEKGL